MRAKIMFKEIPSNEKSIRQRRPLFGMGINDADYMVHQIINKKQVMCPFYQTWMNVLTRCFSKKYHTTRPTYKSCTVSREWLLFSRFRKWMEKQDWKGNQLDKDILIPGNKHYSAESCVFISRQLNLLLNDYKARRGDCPKGVSFEKSTNKFRAECCVDGKKKLIGRFKAAEEAGAAYKQFKSELITKIARQQSDIRIKSGLLLHAEALR